MKQVGLLGLGGVTQLQIQRKKLVDFLDEKNENIN